MRRPASCRPVIPALVLAVVCSPGYAQPDNPVYVDDSPQAWMLFQQADDQLEDNIGEAARLYQELLSEYGLRLIPIRVYENTHFASVRSRVLAKLKSDPELLERYRLIETFQLRAPDRGAAARWPSARARWWPGNCARVIPACLLNWFP